MTYMPPLSIKKVIICSKIDHRHVSTFQSEGKDKKVN